MRKKTTFCLLMLLLAVTSCQLFRPVGQGLAKERGQLRMAKDLYASSMEVLIDARRRDALSEETIDQVTKWQEVAYEALNTWQEQLDEEAPTGEAKAKAFESVSKLNSRAQEVKNENS